MTKLIIKIQSSPKDTQVYDLTEGGVTAAEIAESFNITDTNLYDEVADDAFTYDECYFVKGFDVSGGTATFDLADAKEQAKVSALIALNKESENARGLISTAVLNSQAALDPNNRSAFAQTAIDAINAKVTDYLSRLSNIDGAADAAALKAVTDTFIAVTLPTGYL